MKNKIKVNALAFFLILNLLAGCAEEFSFDSSPSIPNPIVPLENSFLSLSPAGNASIPGHTCTIRPVPVPIRSLACNPALATRDRYVDSLNGNDNFDGSFAAPWKTIQYAARRAVAGDIVYIRGGTYYTDLSNPIHVLNSGAPGRPIMFTHFPGERHQAIIKGNKNQTGNYGAVQIYHQSHIQFCGLNFRGHGDKIFDIRRQDINQNPPVEDITISDNIFYDAVSSCVSLGGGEPFSETPGQGYNAGNFDNIKNVLVMFNRFELCVSEGWNESLTAANGVVDFTAAFNVFLGETFNPKGGEQIDLKEGVENALVAFNTSGATKRTFRKFGYTDGGRNANSLQKPFVRHVDWANNYIYNDPEGAIVITTEGHGDVDHVCVYNNLVDGSDFHGISVYDQGCFGNNTCNNYGKLKNIYIVNNTVSRAGSGNFKPTYQFPQEPLGVNCSCFGGISIDAFVESIVIRNNISWGNDTWDIDPGNQYYNAGNQHLRTIDHNLCRETQVCEFNSNPQFMNPAYRDYRLRSSSPAIDVGSSNLAPAFDFLLAPRPYPQGGKVDLGAFEYTPN